MDVANHHSEQQLQRILDRELRADRAKRFRTVLLAKQGFTAPEIATSYCQILCSENRIRRRG